MTQETHNTEDSLSQVQAGQLGLPLPQEISGEVLLEKYAKGNERDVREVRTRVARADGQDFPPFLRKAGALRAPYGVGR